LGGDGGGRGEIEEEKERRGKCIGGAGDGKA